MKKLSFTLLGLLWLVGSSGCGGGDGSGREHTDMAKPDTAASSAVAKSRVDAPAADDMVFIKGGTFQMGARDGMSYEAPVHEVEVNSFWMDRHEVTVAEFARFINATNYKTEAEAFGWSGVFDVESGQWLKMDGATWRQPEGPGSPAKPDEPVTQVSWADATAYAKWAGKRLPTEAEWEYAARGGLVGKRYVWGDELRPNGKPVANWWQGTFPDNNTGEDGFRMRAPVGSFAPNGYGLHDMTGNVWEWCADWYDPDYYKRSPKHNPQGPSTGVQVMADNMTHEHSPNASEETQKPNQQMPLTGGERVIRGGSWLCAENFCTNYRPGARSHSTPDSGLNNLGFRCIRDE